MALNFGLLDTSIPERMGAMPANALAMRRQRIMQDEQIAGQREQQQMQNALAQMQMRKAQGEMEREQAYRNALSKAPAGDWNAVLPEIRRVAPDRAMALEKQLGEMQKGRAETRAKMSDVAHKKLGMYREALVNVNSPQQFAQWLTAQHGDPDLQELMGSLPSLEDSLSTIPQDPREFEQMKMKSAVGIGKFMEMNKPVSRTLNLGGSERVQMVNPYTGELVSEQTYGKTMSPGEIAADARARASLAQGERQFQATQGMQRERLDLDRSKARAELAGGPKLTELQGKSMLFGSRAAEADKILKETEDKISPASLSLKRGAEGVWGVGGALGAAGNVLLSEDAQKVEQAQRDFVNAILRLESGASIQPSEFQSASKQYFPQPGDSKGVIEQKRRNRETAIEGLRTMAGPAAGKVQPRGASASQTTNSRGWALHTDANGNQAYVSPDGTQFEELR